MIQDYQLRLLPEQAGQEELLTAAIRKKLPKGEKLNDYKVVKRSTDARKKPVMINLTVRVASGDDHEVVQIWNPYKFSPVGPDSPVLAIVGAGPAGLFAALQALKYGIKPIVVERGADVDTRRVDLAEVSRKKEINPCSNYCFGEGGAGAYSDGKLFTRSKKRGNVREVLELLVQHGASESILTDAHPHIGSDKLPHVIKAIRQTIIANGGEVHFHTLADKLILKDERVTGIETDKGRIQADGVILATGHSAHDTFRNLHAQEIPMEAKGIAIGVRLEHPQSLIDRIQYHDPKGRGQWLPPAEYSFVTQVDGRGVYSFCMCPGGVIVPAGSSAGELVVNGMSASARSGRWANSGMVVEIHPGDIPGYEHEGPLEIMALQENLEKKMFRAAGDSIVAPAQRMTDFIAGKLSSSLPATSYAPGIKPGDFNSLLPEFISSRLAQGFVEFGRKAKGFLTPDGVMIGLESRTSSPIRILRDSETLSSTAFTNLYPAGEGAGYAGGIVSAAIDGMRCTEAFARSLES